MLKTSTYHPFKYSSSFPDIATQGLDTQRSPRRAVTSALMVSPISRLHIFIMVVIISYQLIAKIIAVESTAHHGDLCMSKPSVAMSDKEVEFLKGWCVYFFIPWYKLHKVHMKKGWTLCCACVTVFVLVCHVLPTPNHATSCHTNTALPPKTSKYSRLQP